MQKVKLSKSIILSESFFFCTVDFEFCIFFFSMQQVILLQLNILNCWKIEYYYYINLEYYFSSRIFQYLKRHYNFQSLINIRHYFTLREKIWHELYQSCSRPAESLKNSNLIYHSRRIKSQKILELSKH